MDPPWGTPPRRPGDAPNEAGAYLSPMATILIPVPDNDSDVTEVAVPWKLLRRAGHDVRFATERAGTVPACDPLLLRGVLFGKLGAEPEPKAFHAEMIASPEWNDTVAWGDVDATAVDGLVLPGGHAPGMRQYLGSASLQATVARFWERGRPVGAICHGVLVLARARLGDGHSPLFGRRTTCLPAYMERAAYFTTAWKLGRYYRTYPQYVEAEVRGALAHPNDFERGPRELSHRGTDSDDRHAFVVEDGNYVSGRWPGDAYLFAKRFMAKLG